MRVKRVIEMLKLVDDTKDEQLLIAKGKYKLPHTAREFFQMHKRHLKYRKKNGKG